MPEPNAWSRTSPYAILFFAGRIVRLAMKNAWQSLAPLLALLLAYRGDLLSKLMLAGGLLLAVIIGGAVLGWWFFRFQVRDDAILIRSGVIRKKQLDIKYSRIQGIDTQQNPVYRALGVLTVSFDTAGSSGSEGNLPAVTRQFADALRDKISHGERVSPEPETRVDRDEELLLRLDWRDMIRIALADRRALIIIAFIGPLLEQMGEQFEQYVEDAIESGAFDAIQPGAGNGALFVVVIIAAIVLSLLIFSTVAAFLRYHNYELLLDGQTLRSRSGLFTTQEHSIDLKKIQTLRLRQDIVQVWLKRFTMSARRAVSGGRPGGSKAFTIPVVTAEAADELRARFLGPEAGQLTQDPRSKRFQRVSPFYMRGRILFVGVIPSLAVAGFIYTEAGLLALAALLWIPVVSVLAWRSWLRAGFMHDDDELIRRSGLLGYRTVGLLFRKVQRVTITQSRYQRRKQLASLRLHMASGMVNIPYIQHATATQLRDYILFRVESSRQVWH